MPIQILPHAALIFHEIETFEKKLNVVCYVPGIGPWISGVVRRSLAVAELVVAVGLMFFSQLAPKRYAQQTLSTAKVLFQHGASNFIRSFFEMRTLGGLLFCLPYDVFGGRISYPLLEKTIEKSKRMRFESV